MFAKVIPSEVQLTQAEVQNIENITGDVTDVESDMTLEDALSAALSIAGEEEGE